MADRVGQQLGNYRLHRLLGEGGFAEVYLGEHIHLGTQAAIKVLHTQLTSDDVEKFRIEARNIAHLVHPHIVRVLEFGVEGKTPFLVMDYASNGTLRQRPPKGTPLTLVTIVSYVKQVATALQYAHDQRLIHRDIKPENMLVGRYNDVLLSDFGIALVAQSSRYQSTQEVAGTAAYMSPEQIQGKPRPASDQYSLGIVVYEWLSGDRPFHGSFMELCAQHMFASPPPLREKAPTVLPDIEQVVLTALAKDPYQRFINVQAFANALERAGQSERSTFVRPSHILATQLPSSPPLHPSPQPVVYSPPLGAEPHTYESHYADTLTTSELEKGIETHGIERVSPKTRAHVRILDNFTMWLSANLVISTVGTGALAIPIFGLGFWDSLAVIIIFNVLGVLPVAFFSTLGPKLGLRQMTISRFSFGWSVVNVIIGGQLIAALSGGKVPSWAGILILAVLTTLVSIYGYRYVHRYERYAWIPMAVIFAIMVVVAAPHFSIVASSNTTTAAEIAALLSFGGAIYGFATGWSSYAADYNVNQPEETPSSRVFWLTFLGIFIPCVLLETLGMAFTTYAPWAAKFANGLVGDLLAAVVSPLGAFGTLILALLALSVIANNVPNDYSLGLSVQVFGRPFQRVKRYVWTLIGSVIYVLIALPASANFAHTLTDYLLIIAYWLGPWSIILVIEHFVFRHGRYNVNDWNNPSRLPIGWAAIVSMVFGLVGVLLVEIV